MKLAKAMMIAVNEIDMSWSVSSYGVDSLVAAEMRKWCFRELKADINVFELLSGTPIVRPAGQIAEGPFWCLKGPGLPRLWVNDPLAHGLDAE